MIKVKNKGNQIFIGRTLCPSGKITQVNEDDLKLFCKTPGGSALIERSLFIYDEDFQKQKAAASIALQQKAESKVRQELAPILEKEITAKLEKKYGKKIADLELKIAGMAKVKGKKETTVSDSKKKDFVFDPENHVVEHRGAGNYFVMDLEDKKLYGPLTDDERKNFEALQKDE